MGLIKELNDISYTLDKKAQARKERERQKIELEQYKLEIIGSLESYFYKLFDNNSVQEAYKKAILEKENIIGLLYHGISILTRTENGKKYYLYFEKYDITGDLQNNYYKVLNKIKKEYLEIENAQNNDLLLKLEKYIDTLYQKSKSKSYAKRQFKEKIWIDGIINEIAETEEQKQYLYNNYFKVLNKISLLYAGYIEEEKETEREKRENQKAKQRQKRLDRIATLYIINKML